MPTNLPPGYSDAEKRYREAQSSTEKITCLEEMMSIIPKHKGTDKLRADLRKRISKLKTTPRSKKGGSKKESPFNIGKEGAGQVAVVGPVNTGKSALVSALTKASPEVSASPHSTWRPTTGMMPAKDIMIQLIDTPPLSRDYVEIDLFDLIRRSDLILFVMDLQADPVTQLEEAVEMLHEHRIAPLRLKDRHPDEPKLTFIPCLVLANKNDDESSDEDFEIYRELLEDDWPMVAASVETGRNLERFKEVVFERLKIMRVYSKSPGKEADHTAPFVLKIGDTMMDFAAKVHLDFAQKLKTARIWGHGVYDGQNVQREHVLHDGDIVELHI